MLEDTSIDQIQNQIQLINYHLQLTTISQAVVIESNNKSKHTEKGIGVNYSTSKKDQKQNKQINCSQNSAFLEQGFSDQHTLKFEKYLNQQLERQQKTNESIERQKKTKQKKTRYLQKHLTPKSIFNFHGIDIEVVFDRFQNYYASCLVLFYDQFTFESLNKLTRNKVLTNYLLTKYDETIQQIESNNQYITDFCKTFFKNRNYNFLYLFKKPIYKSLPQYSAEALQIVISATFRKCCLYKSTQTLVFTQFDWPGLSHQIKCEKFFQSILMAITEEIQKKKVTLRRITVCCSNQYSYFQFVHTLRLISDTYVQAGLINIEIEKQ